MSNSCIRWLENNDLPSPIFVLDLSEVKRNFNRLKNLYTDINIYYAVKANPNIKIIELLNDLGSSFDCASIEEIKICIDNNVLPAKISYGSTLKKEIDIEKSFKLGVRFFAFDTFEELEKISRKAPGANVFCRLMVPNGGSEWPLSKKFGCNYKLAEKLLTQAKGMMLNPIGVSFHVGSQQMSQITWNKSITIAAKVFRSLAQKNIILNFLNLGGGMPANYKKKVKKK